jgi:AmiR/NasT family two-component response regulator
VIVVFGFAGLEPPHSSVPPQMVENINLAAQAAWSAKEIARLRAELRAVNCQFAGRKLVERAKGIIQTRHGMNEQQAYEYLRKLSRQRRIAMAKLAEDLVAARCP